MANFAKAELLKYGWKEGKGLGKNEDGIVRPVRPTLKFDTAGLGHREIPRFENWAKPFNTLLSNLKVEMQNDSARVFTRVNDQDEIASGNSNKSEEAQPKYTNFLTSSTINNGRLVFGEPKETKVAEEPSLTSGCDEALFKVYRSMKHHSTRYNPALSGKLHRIAMQDKMLLDANTNNVFQLNANPAKESIVTQTYINAKIHEYGRHLTETVWLPLLRGETMEKKMARVEQQLSNCTMEEIKKESECRFPYLTQLYSKTKRRKGRKGRKHSKPLRNNLYDKANNEPRPSVTPTDCLSTASETKQESKTKKLEDHKTVQKNNPDASNEAKDPDAVVINVELDNMNLPQLKRPKKLYDEVSYQPIFLNKQAKKAYGRIYKEVVQSQCLPNLTKNFHLVLDKNKRLLDKLNHNIQKKKEYKRRKVVRKQMEVIVHELKSSAHKNDLNDIVEGLTAVNLAKDVSAEIKKKRTQTHRTPV